MIKIGITMGDPKGIGPEIIAKMWKALSARERRHLRIYGDRTVLESAAYMVGTNFEPKQLAITSSVAPPVGGVSDPDAARVAIFALDAAIEDIKNGVTSALVTAPINKQRLQLVDPSFVGHTERLAKIARVKDAVMMFSCPAHTPKNQTLRIGLVTSHVPLKDVSSRLTIARVLTTIRITVDALRRYFDCPEPRIAVLGLNPHVGEGGALGVEECDVIIPAITKARKEGITCMGPMPPETIFGRLINLDFDGIVAMYHDQGLIPMKIVCPKKAVNITLGLPFIRTSPGHGTAEDIAWRGKASEDGMLAALDMAEHLLKHA